MIDMRKRVCKDIFMILLLVTLFFGIFGNNHCCAISDVTSDAAWELWEPQLSTDSTLKDKTGVIVEFIKILGMIVSIVALSIIGIKYMLGSVEEKANYKQAMVPWVIGATMAFAIGLVPDMIYEATQDTIIDGATMNVAEKSENGTYLEGYDDAIKQAHDKINNVNFYKWISEAVVNYEGNYWYGYRQALHDLRGYNDEYSESNRLKLALESVYDTVIKIEDGTYNPKNIAQSYQGILKEVYRVDVPRKAAQTISLNRFLLQMDAKHNSVVEWINALEHIDDNYNEYYVQGIEDAYEWAIIVASFEEKERIETKMDTEKSRYGIETGYQAGYNRCLNLFCDNMNSSGELLIEEEELKEKVNELKACIKASWQEQIDGEEAAIKFAYNIYLDGMDERYEELLIKSNKSITEFKTTEEWARNIAQAHVALNIWFTEYSNKLHESKANINIDEKGYIYRAAYKSSVLQILNYIGTIDKSYDKDFIQYIKGYLDVSKEIEEGTITKDNIASKYGNGTSKYDKGKTDRLDLQKNLWDGVEYGYTPYTHTP